jgi:hypothetical protein
VGPTAPSGEWYFSLYANAGTADCMILTSMRPTNVRQVPVLDAWGMLALILLLGVAGMAAHRRARQL